MKTLEGDRGIEWGFAMDKLPHGSGDLLDFGPMNFNMSLHAVLKGWNVWALGLEHLEVPPNKKLMYFREDILKFNPDTRFDWILNTSTVEHVGLGRYGDPLGEDFDLQAMAKLRGWMKPDAKMILTVPVGIDAVVGEYHRVYGDKRLVRLIEGYRVLEAIYWLKAEDNSAWLECTMTQALKEIPGQVPEPSMIYLSYALGCFLLCLE